MDRYTETFETWNKVASLYQEQFMDLELYNKSYDFICSSLPKLNSKILDVGCGPGNITRYLLSKRPDFNILGIDIAPNMIELAAKNNPSARFDVMDIRQLSHLSDTYDGIVCGFCIPYLSQAECKTLVADCSNLLNTDGLLYLSFVEGDPEKSAFQVGSSGDRAYFNYHLLSDLTTQLIENNFEVLNVFNTEFKRANQNIEIHTILIGKKR